MSALNKSTWSEEAKSGEYPEVPKSRARKIRFFALLMAMGVATSITVLFLLSLLTYWGGEFSRQADALRQDFLRQKVTLAQHTIQPIIEDLRQSRISRDEARLRARAILRLMTFRDENGDNYIFMSTYEGIMLVQPFEPEKELTSQWNLQDAFGKFIIRELVRTAKSNPEGGFVKYFYRRPLAGVGFEEKLACVIPIPEMECYIGTGAYMQATLRAQNRIYRFSLLTAAGFGLALLIPSLWALRIMLLYHHTKEDLRNQNALRQSEQRYRELVENANCIILRFNQEGRATFLNEFATRFFGFSQEEMLGQPLTGNIVPPMDSRGHDLSSLIGEIVANPAKFSQHINENRLKNGSHVWISWSNQVYRSADSGATEVLSIGFDITERVRVEELLRKKDDAWLASLIRFSQMSTLAMQEITDFALDEGIRLTESEIGYLAFVADDQQTVTMHSWSQSAMRECAVKDKPIVYHLDKMGLWGEAIRQRRPVITNDYSAPNPQKRGQPEGHVIVRRHMNVPIFDEGRIVAVGGVGNKAAEYTDDDVRRLTILLDIMWRLLRNHRAEHTLRTSEDRFRNVARQTGQLIYDCDLDSEKIQWDGAIKEVAGISSESMQKIGLRDWISWIHPEDRPGMETKFDAARQTVGSFEMDYRIRIGERSVFVTHRGVFLDPSNGHGSRLLGTISDVTRQKNIEASQEKLEVQLNLAAKQEAIGRLAGGIAHDFNNMLTLILGNLEIALEQIDPKQPIHAYLVEVRTAAERSADLTSQLLAFARKQTVAPRMLDLNETVDGMLKMLRRLIGENIDLTWTPGADLWLVMIDPAQIDQILANLVVNARDAIAGVGKVIIETRNFAFDDVYCPEHGDFSAGEYVMLAVSDNGCGMDRETQSHIFEPFFTTKDLGKGTGLGLATVYGIVKQNQGFIRVYSEPGSGTTFKIYLLRHSGKAERASVEDSKPSAKGGMQTVLLVEDEPAILKLNKTLLEKLGYTVLPASTPEEAIRLAEEHIGEIHLLLTDVVMPGMNGLDLAKRMLLIRSQIQCLFMSGYTADVIASQGVLDAGVNFIQKPFSMNALAVKVREAMKLS